MMPPPPLPPQPPLAPWWQRDGPCARGSKNSPSGCQACLAGQHSQLARPFGGIIYRECVPCLPGFIQWRTNQSQCLPCPSSGIVCTNQSFIDVEPGFYRPDDGNPAAARCPFTYACAGGVVAGDASCTHGTTGPLCGLCQTGYYRAAHDSDRCLPCNKQLSGLVGTTVVAVLLLILVFALSITYLRLDVTHRHLEHREASIVAKDASCRGRSRMGCWRVFAHAPPAADVAAILKVLIGFAQTLSVVQRFYNVHWPPLFSVFVRALDINIDIQLLPLSCVLGHPLSFYEVFGATLLLPLLCSLTIVTFAAWFRRGHGTHVTMTIRGALASSRVWTLHTWLLLLLYPSLCRTTFAVFDCVTLRGVQYLRDDTSVRCYDRAWVGWASISTLSILVYCLGIPLAAFLLSRTYHDKHTDARRRAQLLLSSYTTTAWWTESVDLIRKLLLTAVVTIVAPNTRLQLWFGLQVSILATIFFIKLEPYRSSMTNLMAAAANISLTFTYATSSLLFSNEWAPPHLREANVLLGVLLILANSAALVILLGVISLAMRSSVRSSHELRIMHANGDTYDPAKPLASGGYHAFLSHVWIHSQDLAASLKLNLAISMPSFRCFLDVDNLSNLADLEANVLASDVVVVILTKDYLRSANCRRELCTALEHAKPLVVVRETSALHGAATRADLEAEIGEIPSATERAAICEFVFGAACADAIEWHREKHLRHASFMQLIQRFFCSSRVAAPLEQSQHHSTRSPSKMHDSPTDGGCELPALHMGSVVHAKARQEQLAACKGQQLVTSCHYADMKAPAIGMGGTSSHDSMLAQLRAQFGALGVELRSVAFAQDAAVEEPPLPYVLLVTPGCFGHQPLVDEIRQVLLEIRANVSGNLTSSFSWRLAGRRPIIPLFNTALPFEDYIKACPEELKRLGLLQLFFAKWPESSHLQRAAAEHALLQLVRPTFSGIPALPAARPVLEDMVVGVSYMLSAVRSRLPSRFRTRIEDDQLLIRDALPAAPGAVSEKV